MRKRDRERDRDREKPQNARERERERERQTDLKLKACCEIRGHGRQDPTTARQTTPYEHNSIGEPWETSSVQALGGEGGGGATWSLLATARLRFAQNMNPQAPRPQVSEDSEAAPMLQRPLQKLQSKPKAAKNNTGERNLPKGSKNRAFRVHASKNHDVSGFRNQRC